ncbi:MAG TPA: phosphoribosyltransferase [Thermoprotei archaeon]|nr:phosphoribosyltransferase [Thermoprotei archaeon]
MESLSYLLLTLNDIYDMSLKLSHLIKRKLSKVDSIVAISKGGLIVARLLADFLAVKYLYTIQIRFYQATGETNKKPELLQPLYTALRHRTALVVDDVSDTGSTLKLAYSHVRERIPVVYTATLFIKPWTKFIPDFYLKTTDKWIIFPHEYAEFVREAIFYFKKRGWSLNRILQWLKIHCGFKEETLMKVLEIVDLDHANM